MKSKFFSALVLALATFGSAGAYAGRDWNFTAYHSATGQAVVGGEFHLTDPDEEGNARVSIILPRSAMTCIRGRVPAKVAETATETIVTIPPMMHGCNTVRYTFFKDGTGGFVENLIDGEWKKNTKDNNLTPKN